MSVATGMFEDIEQDTETTAGDVIQFSTVEYDIAIGTFKNWCKAFFSLAAGHIVKVTAKSSDESSFFFVNRNVKHTLLILNS